MRNRPVVRVYESVLNARDFTHSWMPENSFPIGDATLAQRNQLRQISGIEIDFPGPAGEDVEFLRSLVDTVDRRCVMFAAGSTSAPRSRIRTYRGLFPRGSAIKAFDHVELEVDVGTGYSHFAGVALVTPGNLNECTRWLSDGLRSFIIISDDDYLTGDFVRQTLLYFMSGIPGVPHVNYMALVAEFCSRGDVIFRFGGRSGHGDSQAQVFVRHADSVSLTDRISRLMQRNS